MSKSAFSSRKQESTTEAIVPKGNGPYIIVNDQTYRLTDASVVDPPNEVNRIESVMLGARRSAFSGVQENSSIVRDIGFVFPKDNIATSILITNTIVDYRSNAGMPKTNVRANNEAYTSIYGGTFAYIGIDLVFMDWLKDELYSLDPDMEIVEQESTKVSSTHYWLSCKLQEHKNSRPFAVALLPPSPDRPRGGEAKFTHLYDALNKYEANLAMIANVSLRLKELEGKSTGKRSGKRSVPRYKFIATVSDVQLISKTDIHSPSLNMESEFVALSGFYADDSLLDTLTRKKGKGVARGSSSTKSSNQKHGSSKKRSKAVVDTPGSSSAESEAEEVEEGSASSEERDSGIKIHPAVELGSGSRSTRVADELDHGEEIESSEDEE